MNCCTVLIKIKDFLPKLSKESYDNYICIFNNDEFEGRISLMQYEYQHINHEIKDINSDVIYKIKVIDLISKEIIGISEYCIKFEVINNLDIGTSINFINQIRVSPKRKNNQKISSNFIYCNKLNLTISTEIIKFNKNPVNYISKENSEFLKLNLKLHSGINNRFTQLNRDNINNNYYYNKKINSSINNKGINSRLNNEMNNMSLIKEKNNISSGLINEDDKNNINLNMHNITVQNYYTINSSPPLNINSVKNKKIYTKKYFKKKNMNKIKNNKIDNEKKENFYDFWKQNEINYNNIKIKKGYQSSTTKSNNMNNTTDYFSSIEKMEQFNLTNRNIKVRKRIIRTKKRKTKYNNNSFRVINLSSSKNNSVEKINSNLNSYRCISTKKDENKNNLDYLDYKRINSFKISSYNLTYNSNSNSLQKQKYKNKLESILSPKNNTNKKKYSIKSVSYNNLTERLKSKRSKDNIFNIKQIGIINLKKNNNSLTHKKNNKYRKECKNNIISILQYYILLNKKMKKLKDSYNYNVSEYSLEKEKYMNIMEKKNIIEEKNNENKLKGYIYVNINSKLNNQIISKFKNIKNKEIKLFEIIFNKEITKNDISKRLTEEKIVNEEEKNKINLYLNLLKNMIKYYGNISQIYNNNKNKKYQLLRLLINNGIEINRNDFLYKKKKENFKEIKKEKEKEEKSILNKEINGHNNNKDNSLLNKNENNKNDIIERILISEFPLKYGNITNKKFIKIKSNEFSFNNEFKILAFYNNNKIILKIKAKKDCINKEYTLDEFVSVFIKNNNIYEEEGKNNNKLTNLKNNTKKINFSYENNSRNHKIVIIKEMAFKDDLNKKCINKKNLAKSKKDDIK